LFSATEFRPGTVGVDIGGTKIAAGYLTASGHPVLLGTASTTPYDGHANLETITRLISAPEAADATLLGVSVATTFDHDGSLRDPRGWFGWKGQVLADLLDRPERRALVFADAAAGAVGEHARGAGRGFDQLLYITVGTGVSHSFVLDGKPLNGAHNSAYFSGYTPQARCQRDQCDFADVEKICSGPALAREYSGPAARDARPVIAAARAGEARAVEIVEHAAFHLGALIATMVMMYDPAGVVIGGGLGTGVVEYRDRAIETARSLIITEHGRGIPITAAELGPSSCWVGAIEMAHQHDSSPGVAAPVP
jgi:glucokinase